MADSNGETPAKSLDLREVLEFRMEDGSVQTFEVKAILEDTESGQSYAILERAESEGDEGEVIVTDLQGNLLEDEELAEEILEEFLVFSEEAADDGGEKPE